MKESTFPPNPGTIRSGVENHLASRSESSQFLISRYYSDLETQIMVFPGHTEVQRRVWEGDGQTWQDHRWPHNAMKDTASYSDKPLTYDPGSHLRFIGTTWWDFRKKVSVAVALDIDFEEGHAKGTTTVNQQQMDDIIARLGQLDYVTLVRSKSGQGIHVYTFFDEDSPPESSNHNEHKAHAGAVLGKLSSDLDYDLSQHVDVMGSVLWIWAKEKGEKGFDLIQEQTVCLTVEDLKPHYDLSKFAKSTKEYQSSGYTESGTRVKAPSDVSQMLVMDQTHKDILLALEKTGYECVWNEEFQQMQTRTSALKQVYEQFKEEGRPLLGLFETQTSVETRVNCYLAPRPNGVFRVTRYGPTPGEHPLWAQAQGPNKDKTTIYFNTPTDPSVVFRNMMPTELKGKPCGRGSDVAACCKVLGIECTLTEEEFSQDNVFIHVAGMEYYAKHKSWKQAVPLNLSTPGKTRSVQSSGSLLPELETLDTQVRYTHSEDGVDLGWRSRKNMVSSNGLPLWGEPTENALRVTTKRISEHEASELRAMAEVNPWTLVDVPFQNEYPGDRQWNPDSIQFQVEPSEEPAPHPHWTMILDHLGRNLTPVVEEDEWCKKHGVNDGSDYLRHWLSNIIKHPFAPLPYLFFYGRQNTGKSVFHEMLTYLFTAGSVSSANNAMDGSFNGQMARCIIAVIEEMDISNNKKSYNRIKAMTTSDLMEVHYKGKTPYYQRNKCHFIQTANSPTHCPIEDGDTRIVVVEVSTLENEVPRGVMDRCLEEEAPAFLRTLLNTQLGNPSGRMRLPVLRTNAKQDLEENSLSNVHAFVEANVYPCKGHTVTVKDLYDRYVISIAETGADMVSMVSFRTQLSPRWVVARGKGNVNRVANVTFNKHDRPLAKAVELNDKGRLCNPKD